MGEVRQPRRTRSERACRFAELHRELAALYAEEVEVLEEEEGEGRSATFSPVSDWELLLSIRESVEL
jgi:hypothetical protein